MAWFLVTIKLRRNPHAQLLQGFFTSGRLAQSSRQLCEGPGAGRFWPVMGGRVPLTESSV